MIPFHVSHRVTKGSGESNGDRARQADGRDIEQSWEKSTWWLLFASCEALLGPYSQTIAKGDSLAFGDVESNAFSN